MLKCNCVGVAINDCVRRLVALDSVCQRVCCMCDLACVYDVYCLFSFSVYLCVVFECFAFRVDSLSVDTCVLCT